MNIGTANDLVIAHEEFGVDITKKWRKWRRWFNSEFHRDVGMERVDRFDRPGGTEETAEAATEPSIFETNYPYGYVDNMAANIVPSKPGVQVRARDDAFAEAAAARDALANDAMRMNRMVTQLRRASSFASICGRGFLRTFWADGKPAIRAVHPERVFFDQQADDWDDIRYLVYWTDITKEEFEARAAKTVPGREQKIWKPSAVEQAKKSYIQGTVLAKLDEDALRSTQDPTRVYQWIRLYEIYDFTDKDTPFMQFVKGGTEPLFAGETPYKQVRNPFSMISFNDNLQNLNGTSDVQLIEPNLLHLNTLDTLEIWHGMSAIPRLLADSAAIGNVHDFIKAMRDPKGPNSLIQVAMKDKVPLRDAIYTTPVAQLSPSVTAGRNRAQETIEFTLGLPQFTRGTLGADVATEVALADASMRTRNGWRQRTVYDAIEVIARNCVALYQQFLPADAVVYTISRDNMRAAVGRALAGFDNEKLINNLFDYEVLPGAGTESNRIAKQRDMANSFTIWQWAIGAGFVDGAAFMREFAATMDLGHLVTGKGLAAAGGGMPMPPGPSAGVGAPADTLATGAIPGGDMPLPGNVAGGAGIPAGASGTKIGTTLAKGTEGVQDGQFVLPTEE